jgi:hypothetical protein
MGEGMGGEGMGEPRLRFLGEGEYELYFLTKLFRPVDLLRILQDFFRQRPDDLLRILLDFFL